MRNEDVRLIDADAFKGKVICNHLYSGVQKLIEIDEIPTAFDLESVIADFEGRLECTKLQLEVLNAHADKDALSVKNDILFFRERAERYEEFLEILKSAINATNGKIGG